MRTAEVRARVEGIVEKRLFAEGGTVRAGQPLFRLDNRTYAATAQAAEADVELKQLNLKRMEALLPERAVSQQEVDAARAALKLAQATLTRARLDLDNATVPAPISGQVDRAQVTEGALVGRGDATLMTTIRQLDPVHVLFTQPNADALRLRAALESGTLKSGSGALELVLEDGTTYPAKGRLASRDLTADPATGAVTFKAEFPNPQKLLLPGSFVRVRLPQAVAENVVTVPQKAVLSGAQGQYVLLVGADGKSTPRPVKVGAMAGTDFVIDSGLEGGETLIVGGQQKARPGTPVKAVPVQGGPQQDAQARTTPAAGAR